MVASSERCQPSRASLYLHPFDEVLKLEVLRGTEPKTLFIRVLGMKDSADGLSGLANSRENFFSTGIPDLNDELRFIVGMLRSPSGVVVVARVANFMSSETLENWRCHPQRQPDTDRLFERSPCGSS
jgi:hypothetical protein